MRAWFGTFVEPIRLAGWSTVVPGLLSLAVVGCSDAKIEFEDIKIEVPANSVPFAQNDTASTMKNVSVTIDVKANDSDSDGDTLTITQVSSPTSGAVSITAAQQILYQPNTGFYGADAFQYTIEDGKGGVATASVAVLVNDPANINPVAGADSATTNEDTAITISVLTNDSDADGDTLSVVLTSTPAHGSVTYTSTSVTYTPNANYNGADSFTYTITDGRGGGDTGTVTMTVTSVNDAPVATAQSQSLNEDGNVATTLAGTDVDGDTLSYAIVTPPSHGSLSGTTPNLTYTPAADYVGADSFTFTVNDGTVTSSAATVSITVNGLNDAPVANAASVSVNEDASLGITLSGTDVDGDTLSYTVVTPPSHGSLSGTAPNLTYTPTANYYGPDSIVFKVNDGTVNSANGTVSITVNPTNDAPSATAQSVSTPEDVAKAITLAGSDIDGDALSYAVATPPSHGSLSGTAPNLTYTPAANYFGSDSFTFTVNDGTVTSSAATVSITVSSVNDAPVANAGSASTNEDTAKAITVSASDTEGDTLTYTVIGSPSHGSLSGTGPGYTYTPAANYNGADSFTFRVSDGSLNSNTATFSLTVTAVNDAPVATAQSVTATEDTGEAITLAGTDTEGDTLSYTVASPPSHGSLSGTAPNLTYTPTADYSGADSFTFTVSDGAATSAAATVSISVSAVNDAPTASAGSASTNEDTAKAITVSASDPEGNTLTYAVISNPAHGSLSGTGPGFTYTPAANYNGADSFTFRVNDGSLNSNIATFSLTINAVNDAPVATAQSVTATEDTGGAITLAGTDTEGDTLSYAVASPPSHGSLSGSAPNLTYTPSANYVGADSFTFTANDGAATSAAATVSITVSGVNDAPTASAGSDTTAEDTAKSVNVSASDIEGDTLSYAIVSNPTHGTLSGSGPSFTYTPAANYNGADSFTFKVNDGSNDSNTATFSLTVTAVNDTPVANAQSVGVAEDIPQAITLTGSDVEGSGLSYNVTSGPSHGSLTGTVPNLTYTPDLNYVGSDSFAFTVSDGSLTSAAATISISVGAGNDAPVASNGSTSTNEDTGVSVTLSATDQESDPLTYAIVSPPSHGSLSGSGSSQTYTPAANYNGSDSFTFRANDGTSDSNIATVSITINAVNDAPTSSAGSASTPEDTAKAVTVSASDVEGSTLTYEIVTGPSHGSLTGSGPGFNYTPAANYNGADSFTFRVSDGSLTSNTSTFSLTVTAANDAPSATAQSVSTNEDVAKAITLAGTDIDGDTLSYAIAGAPSHGALSGTPPNVTYTPAANYNGADSFTFTVSDGTATSAAATVSITVTAVNDAPVASAGSDSTNEDTAKSVTVGATDAEGDTLSYSIVSGPSHGSLTGTGPSFNYTPVANYNGADSFTFKANDGNSDSNTATFSLTVNAANDAPSATAQSTSTNEDTAKAITLAGTDIDGDTLSYNVTGAPSHGALSGTAPNLTYTPVANYNGSDSFTFTVNDGTATSAAATVSITVTAVNDAPVANAGSDSTNEDTAKSVSVSATDTEGDTLSYSIVTGPAHGSLTGSGPSFTYTPAANYNGTDSFTFKANDGSADSNTATFSLTVNAVNDTPVATAQSPSTNEDTAKAITLAGTDVEGSTLTYNVASSPSHGSLSGTAPNLTYTPVANYNGSDSFTFTVSDGSLTSSAATVSITVTAVNDAPVATGGSDSTNEDTAKAITVGATDTEGDTLSYVIVSSPAHGSLSGSGPGFTYTPAANYNGSDSFTFKANDGNADSNTVTFNLTINAVNDNPVADAQSVSTPEETGKAITLSGSDLEGSSLTYEIVGSPSHGALSGTPPNVTYTPTTNYFGSDSFTFRVYDGSLYSSSATVSLTVTAVNDLPTANAQSVGLSEDGTKAITLAGTDPDGDTLTYSIVASPTNGSLSGTPPSVTYTPTANYFGNDSFTFRVHDGTGYSTAATVSITVNSVNDAPVAVNDTAGVHQDVSMDISVLWNDSDLEGNTLTLQSVGSASHGTASVVGNAVRYVPNAGYTGSDSVSYTINDGNGGTASATVSITVVPDSGSRSLSISGAAALASNACSAYTITTRDADGYQVAVSTGTTVNLTTNGTGTFYSDLGCSSSITSTSLSAGAISGTVYYKPTAGGSHTLTAADSTAYLTSGTTSVTVTSYQLTFSGATTVLGTACSGAITITHRDGAGTATSVGGTALTINLALSGSYSTMHTGAACGGGGVTSTTIAANQNSTTIYMKPSSPGSTIITATATGVSSGSHTISAANAAPSKWVISGSGSITTGVCSSALTVSAQDSSGYLSSVSSNTTVTLSGAGSGAYYSDSACTNSITSLVINSGTYSKDFYFKDGTVETPTLSASGTLTTGTLGISVVAPPDELRIQGPPSQKAGVCSLKYTVKAIDGATAYEKNFSSATTVNLSTSGAGTFYSDAQCSSSITSIVIPAGRGIKTFFYKAASAETPTLTASATGLDPGTYSARVTSATEVSAISKSHLFACAILSDRTIKCWGENAVGQLGNGSTAASVSTPVAVSSLTNAVDVAAGQTHTCAALGNGTVKCWGKNNFGQLGNNSTTNSSSPVTVSGISNAVAVAVGGFHSCALLSDRTLKCWGKNLWGEVGDGMDTDRWTPVAVRDITEALQVVAGIDHTCAVLAGGTVKCWGYGTDGQLGYGGNSYMQAPIGVVNISTAVSLTGANFHTCAVLADKTARCWGLNLYGEQGDASTTQRESPVVVSGLSNVDMLASGGLGVSSWYSHTCALLSSGVGRCWGYNAYYQVGDDTTTSRTTPAIVSDISGAVAIQAGTYSTCALLSNGTVQCWGRNNVGQLGNGNTTQQQNPVSVLLP